MLQVNLSRCIVQQVAATDDVSDGLFVVIDDNGQLVGEQAIPAPEDKIAGSLMQGFAVFALGAVLKNNALASGDHPDRNFAFQIHGHLPACARVNGFR